MSRIVKEVVYSRTKTKQSIDVDEQNSNPQKWLPKKAKTWFLEAPVIIAEEENTIL